MNINKYNNNNKNTIQIMFKFIVIFTVCPNINIIKI